MSLIQWSKEYSVGVKKLDNQHKKIIKILNHVIEQQFQATDDKTIEEILSDLQDYMKEHFKTEEEYMLKKHYSGYEEQRREHNQFINRVLAAQKEYTQDGRLTSLNIFNFIWDWFSHHILKIDIKLLNIV